MGSNYAIFVWVENILHCLVFGTMENKTQLKILCSKQAYLGARLRSYQCHLITTAATTTTTLSSPPHHHHCLRLHLHLTTTYTKLTLNNPYGMSAFSCYYYYYFFFICQIFNAFTSHTCQLCIHKLSPGVCVYHCTSTNTTTSI